MKKIFIIDRDDKLKDDLQNIFKSEKQLRAKRFEPTETEKMLKDIPDMFIINEDSLLDKEDIIELCKQIRNDENNAITPIAVMSSNKDTKHKIEVLKNEIELYIEEPVDSQVLYYSIKNIMRLLNSNRMVSPLTGLPGNVQIQAEMKQRLLNHRKFAMLYIDLDNFKAFNDKYGFSNGDEMIKFTAKIITDNVNDENGEDNFVGHIGGDDFCAIVEGDNFEKICQNIIAQFDAQVGKFFTKEDMKNGYIEVENRKGIMEEFPITSISIGAVEVTNKKFKNTLEIGEVGAAVKHLAKTIYGSTYVIDRRNNE